jgi:hypothetical protein
MSSDKVNDCKPLVPGAERGDARRAVRVAGARHAARSALLHARRQGVPVPQQQHTLHGAAAEGGG